MKFGHHLEETQFEPWKNEYIQYNSLKHYLKSTQLSPTGWTDKDEAHFIELVQNEFTRVRQFVQFKTNQIAQDMKPERINDLIKFIQVNTTGFQKIVKKHDKWTKTILHSLLLTNIVKELDAFILQLSLQQKWTTTRKYWVHPDHLTELEAVLLFNLPKQQDKKLTNTVYFDNTTQFSSYSQLLEQKDLAHIIRARWSDHDTTTVQIEKKIYHESYFKNKGIYTKQGSIQLPYSDVSTFLFTGSYDGPHPEQAEAMYDDARQLRSVLRCVHRRTTFQETPHFRITLDTDITLIKEMGLDWTRNDAPPFDRDRAYRFPFSVLEIKSSSANKPLPTWITKDMIRLCYEVPFFSKYLHGASQFFSDRVPMLPWWLNEMQKDIRTRPSYAAMSTKPSEVLAVQPDTRTTSSCTVVVVVNDDDDEQKQKEPSSFYTDKLKQIKAVINNHNNDDNDGDDSCNRVSMTRWLYAKLTNNLDSLLQQEPQPGQKKKRSIEPKVHFANERTFISWLQFSALLLAVSLGLINFGDSVSKGSGAFFIVIAMVLACYAELRFQYRSWQIRFRFDQRFDDMLGPAVLCGVLILALLINLGLRLNQPVPVDPSLFGYNATVTNTTTTTTEVSSPSSVWQKHKPVIEEDEP